MAQNFVRMSSIVQIAAIVAIALAGAYVGYHAWQDSLDSQGVVPHGVDFGYDSQIDGTMYNSQVSNQPDLIASSFAQTVI